MNEKRINFDEIVKIEKTDKGYQLSRDAEAVAKTMFLIQNPNIVEDIEKYSRSSGLMDLYESSNFTIIENLTGVPIYIFGTGLVGIQEPDLIGSYIQGLTTLFYTETKLKFDSFTFTSRQFGHGQVLYIYRIEQFIITFIWNTMMIKQFNIQIEDMKEYAHKFADFLSKIKLNLTIHQMGDHIAVGSVLDGYRIARIKDKAKLIPIITQYMFLLKQAKVKQLEKPYYEDFPLTYNKKTNRIEVSKTRNEGIPGTSETTYWCDLCERKVADYWIHAEEHLLNNEVSKNAPKSPKAKEPVKGKETAKPKKKSTSNNVDLELFLLLIRRDDYKLFEKGNFDVILRDPIKSMDSDIDRVGDLFDLYLPEFDKSLLNPSFPNITLIDYVKELNQKSPFLSKFMDRYFSNADRNGFMNLTIEEDSIYEMGIKINRQGDLQIRFLNKSIDLSVESLFAEEKEPLQYFFDYEQLRSFAYNEVAGLRRGAELGKFKHAYDTFVSPQFFSLIVRQSRNYSSPDEVLFMLAPDIASLKLQIKKHGEEIMSLDQNRYFDLKLPILFISQGDTLERIGDIYDFTKRDISDLENRIDSWKGVDHSVKEELVNIWHLFLTENNLLQNSGFDEIKQSPMFVNKNRLINALFWKFCKIIEEREDLENKDAFMKEMKTEFPRPDHIIRSIKTIDEDDLITFSLSITKILNLLGYDTLVNLYPGILTKPININGYNDDYGNLVEIVYEPETDSLLAEATISRNTDVKLSIKTIEWVFLNQYDQYHDLVLKMNEKIKLTQKYLLWLNRKPSEFGGTIHDFIAHAESELGEVIEKAYDMSFMDLYKEATDLLKKIKGKSKNPGKQEEDFVKPLGIATKEFQKWLAKKVKLYNLTIGDVEYGSYGDWTLEVHFKEIEDETEESEDLMIKIGEKLNKSPFSYNDMTFYCYGRTYYLRIDIEPYYSQENKEEIEDEE